MNRLPHTIGRILDLAVAATPDRVAVSIEDRSLSFAECDRRANRVARALRSLGVRRGERVLFWSPTSLASIDVFLATQRLGAAFVPINHAFSPEEAGEFVRYVRPCLFVADASLAEKTAAIAAATGVAVATIDGSGPGHALDPLADHASDAALVDACVEDEDIHAIFLTSGSTGQSKGVMVSHRASWYRAYHGNSRAPAAGGRGEVNMFPLFHWAGWHFTLCAWSQARAIHLTPRADADALGAILERWQPAYMYAIPAVWQRMLDETPRYDPRCLRLAMTGTSRVEPAMIDALKARFPRASCTIGWGATELGVGCQIDDDDIPAKPYSIGLPGPGVEIRILDGELQGRSDQLMSGYFELPDQTAAVMQDGWYCTGDLAERDAEGFITITGRRREIIRSGGETIAPAEVEAAVRACPGVRDVCVVGLPDARWGEVVCAVIVPEQGGGVPSLEALRTQLAPRLAAFKHPRRIVTLDTLPRTAATGQIQRAQVRESILALAGASG